MHPSVSHMIRRVGEWLHERKLIEMPTCLSKEKTKTNIYIYINGLDFFKKMLAFRIKMKNLSYIPC